VTYANRGFFGGVPVYKSGGTAAAPPAPRLPPTSAGPPGGACDYSFIFSNGEYESIPGDTSPIADKFGCGKRIELPEVIDPKPGLVWDPTRQDPGSDGWGRYPKSGRALIYEFPNCKDGRIVVDVVKMQKGHTEGYEPNITDKIVELAVSAKGGKIATGTWTPPPLPPPPRGPFG
jgi:hypothetical protein